METLSKCGIFGNETGNFSSPKGLAIDSNNNVYVVDSGNYRIQKFDGNGDFIKMWKLNSQVFANPEGIAIDSNDNVYVLQPDFGQIQKFDSNGNNITEWEYTQDYENLEYTDGSCNRFK